MNHLLINIDVPDMEKAIEFYTSGLPLYVGRRFDAEFVELLGMPSPIYLLKKDKGTRPFPDAQTTRTYERHWCPIHMDFAVSDLESARKRLLEAGAVEEVPIKVEPYGKLAIYRDPFGHGLCLIEFNRDGYNSYL